MCFFCTTINIFYNPTKHAIKQQLQHKNIELSTIKSLLSEEHLSVYN